MKKRKVRRRTPRQTVRQLLATDEEWRAIAESVEVARAKHLNCADGSSNTQQKCDLISGVTRLLNLSLAQDTLIARLAADRNKRLDDGLAGYIISRSAAANDTKFFRKLAKALQPKLAPSTIAKKPDPLGKLLLEYWTHGTKVSFARYRRPHLSRPATEYTPLCFFRDRAITEFYCTKLNLFKPGSLRTAVVESHLETVRKRIQRLGLVRGKKRIVKSYARQGAKVLLNQ